MYHTLWAWLALFMAEQTGPYSAVQRVTDILPQANLNYFEAMALWSRADWFLCTSDANHIHADSGRRCSVQLAPSSCVPKTCPRRVQK